MRRYVRMALFGGSFLVVLQFGTCLFNYCFRHDFLPPICQEID